MLRLVAREVVQSAGTRDRRVGAKHAMPVDICSDPQRALLYREPREDPGSNLFVRMLPTTGLPCMYGVPLDLGAQPVLPSITDRLWYGTEYLHAGCPGQAQGPQGKMKEHQAAPLRCILTCHSPRCCMQGRGVRVTRPTRGQGGSPRVPPVLQVELHCCMRELPRCL